MGELMRRPDRGHQDEPVSDAASSTLTAQVYERLRDYIILVALQPGQKLTLDLLKEEGTAVLLVTHEPEEAMRMADRIALMREGRIVQEGAPYTIYNNPVDREAAQFFSDINVIHGVVRNFAASTPFGEFLTPGLADRADVEIVIRPQHLKMDFDRNGTGPLPTSADGVPARGRVARARFVGNQSIVEPVMDHDGSGLKATIPVVFLGTGAK